jgi:hypothetical protein
MNIIPPLDIVIGNVILVCVITCVVLFYFFDLKTKQTLLFAKSCHV